MPRKEYTIHYIYKTTNIVNGKFYIGMHSTFNLEDGYIGSGTYLWNAIRKHGRENFVKEILEFLPDRNSLKLREKEIVCKEFIKDPLCMNLKPGGEGGFNNEEHRLKCSSAGTKAYVEKMKNDNEFHSYIVETKRNQNRHLVTCDWTGRKHKEETKIAIGLTNSIKQKGEGNSQYGTCWITNGSDTKKIGKDQLEIHLQNGWKRGRS